VCCLLCDGEKLLQTSGMLVKPVLLLWYRCKISEKAALTPRASFQPVTFCALRNFAFLRGFPCGKGLGAHAVHYLR